MLKRLVKQPILVVREGKQVEPRINEVFEFTEAEVAEISKLNPSAIELIVAGEETVTPVAPAKK